MGGTVRTFHNNSDKNCRVLYVVMIYFGRLAFRQCVFMGFYDVVMSLLE